jgi:topoisomerase IV subunit A
VPSTAKDVLLLTRDGKALVLALSEVKKLKNGGRGVLLIGLDKDDRLCAAMPLTKEGVLIKGLGRAAKQREDTHTLRQLADWRGARGRKGKFLEPRVKDPQVYFAKPEAGENP